MSLAVEAPSSPGSGRCSLEQVALQGLFDVSQLLAREQEPRRALPRALGLLRGFWQLREAAVVYRRGDAGVEVVQADARPAPGGLGFAPLLQQACRHACEQRCPWIVESEWRELSSRGLSPACSELELDRSFVSVPLCGASSVHGALCIERSHGPSDQAGFHFDADVRLLTTIANMIVGRGPTPNVFTRGREDAVGNEPTPTMREGGARSVLGDHPSWRRAIDTARSAARSNATVLLRGESGTGKELLARQVHEASRRREGPYVALNCAALSDSLLESELFGHEKGAFTGAVSRRRGRFEQADGGTLFLDEVGEISGTFQARLLRVLQLGEFERVGGTTTLHVDTRVVAATNRNLEEEVRAGRFRADLYYRLSVIPVFLPPLRERGADIGMLARAFLDRFNETNGTALVLQQSAIAALERHPFPGNVRELENAVQRAATLATTMRLTAADFAWLESDAPLSIAPPARGSVPPPPAFTTPLTAVPPLPDDPEDEATTRERLVLAMQHSGWVQAKAARLLGLTPRQLGYALRKHRITVRKI